jgi:hypothetical protein
LFCIGFALAMAEISKIATMRCCSWREGHISTADNFEPDNFLNVAPNSKLFNNSVIDKIKETKFQHLFKESLQP